MLENKDKAKTHLADSGDTDATETKKDALKMINLLESIFFVIVDFDEDYTKSKNIQGGTTRLYSQLDEAGQLKTRIDFFKDIKTLDEIVNNDAAFTNTSTFEQTIASTNLDYKNLYKKA